MAAKIDAEKFRAPATKGDVAGVAIDVSLALREIVSALRAIKGGGNLETHINELQDRAAEVRKQFDLLILEDGK